MAQSVFRLSLCSEPLYYAFTMFHAVLPMLLRSVHIYLHDGPLHPEDCNLVPMEGMCFLSLIFLKASSSGIWVW